jgi:transposase-like protein
MHDRARSHLAAARRQQSGHPPTRYRYPAELRSRMVAHALRRRGGGASLEEVARELGVTGQTLGRWLREEGHTPKLRRVVVARGAPTKVLRTAEHPSWSRPPG